MTIKSLDELRQADERTLRFIAGGGLGLNVAMNPDDSSRHWQEVAVGVILILAVYIDQLHLGNVRARRRSPGGTGASPPAVPAFLPPSVVGRRNGQT